MAEWQNERIQVSGSKLQVSSSTCGEFQVSDSRFRVSGFGFQVPGSRWQCGFRFRFSPPAAGRQLRVLAGHAGGRYPKIPGQRPPVPHNHRSTDTVIDTRRPSAPTLMNNADMPTCIHVCERTWVMTRPKITTSAVMSERCRLLDVERVTSARSSSWLRRQSPTRPTHGRASLLKAGKLEPMRLHSDPSREKAALSRSSQPGGRAGRRASI